MFVYCLSCITFISEACVTRLIQQGASTVLEMHNVRETSPDRELCWLTAGGGGTKKQEAVTSRVTHCTGLLIKTDAEMNFLALNKCV